MLASRTTERVVALATPSRVTTLIAAAMSSSRRSFSAIRAIRLPLLQIESTQAITMSKTAVLDT